MFEQVTTAVGESVELAGRSRENPAVSVVLIFLNPGRYFEEAVKSVYAQSLPDWELLLVDDGSSDGSTQQARSWARQDPGRVCYLEHDEHRNRGTAASRNLGLRHARGEYLTFIDADDVWLSQKLERQVGVMEAHPKVGIVYGLELYWRSWAGGKGRRYRDHLPKLGVPSGIEISPPLLIPMMLLGGGVVPSVNTMVRRSAMERAGLLDESFRGLYEDQAWYAKFLLHEPAVAVDECWAKYRQHPDSLCATNASEAETQARGRFLQWLEAYMLQHGIDDRATWSALRQARWLLRHPRVARVMRSIRRRIGAGDLKRFNARSTQI